MKPHAELAQLFAGRTDCYGAGGDRPFCIKQPLTDTVWFSHVTDQAIGVYPLTPEGTVHWGCSDFDTEDAVPEARAVQAALRVMAIPSWPEISRSGGIHLWVFLPKNVWVPAADMRYTLLLAHHLAEVPAKEVNPKALTGLSNFVRIPYAGASLGTGRQVMLDRISWAPLTLRGFLDHTCLQTHAMVSPEQLRVHGLLWASGLGRAPEEPVRGAAYDGSLDGLVKRFVHGGAVLLFRNGPENGDRSEGLWRLANDCRRADLTTDEALAILVDAHDRWGTGKHAGPDTEDKLWRYYVSRAYGQWVE